MPTRLASEQKKGTKRELLERENVRAWEWGHAKNASTVCLERESKREDRARENNSSMHGKLPLVKGSARASRNRRKES